LAAFIALVTLLSYFFMSQDNPFTGEPQRVALSPRDEVALGLRAAPEMIDQHGGLYPSDEAQAELDRIGARLLKGLQSLVRRRIKESPYRFEFHLLRDDQTVNAFALPGGQVFITAALYERLQTEGQRAGVLGHEIGHVVERHGAERLAQQQLTQGLAGAVGVAGGDVDSARLAAAIGQLVNMKYGRDAELESDRWGVRIMAEAGYDPRAMLGVMKVLEEAGGAGPPEFLSTHPKPANRVEYIQQVLETEFPEGIPEGIE
jgi:predicted Zn-dependent protease